MFIYCCIFLSYSLHSQKNAFSLVYTPAITKLNTNYLAKNMVLGTFQYWYTTRKPIKPMYGFNAGFGYQRKINGKISLTTGFFYTELKQHSGNFYGDKEFDQPPVNYLASELVFKYVGYEVPLTVSYLMTKSKKWDSRLELGVGINLMSYFEAQDYVVGLKVGKDVGCCTRYNYVNTSFSALKYVINKPYFYRMSFSIGYEFDYNISPHFQFSVAPLFKYYSNALKDKSTFGALDADAYFLGLQSKINFKF
jgi:hypothetical protein